MANPHRGEIEAEIAGRRYTLCLTLGALAELEAAFGVEDLGALGARFARGGLSSRDLLRLLAAGLRGGGTPVTDAEVAALPLPGGLAGTVALAGRLLEATFGPVPEGTGPHP